MFFSHVETDSDPLNGLLLSFSHYSLIFFVSLSFSTLDAPMFAAPLGSVSASPSSFLSQIASIGPSYAPSTSTSSSLVLHMPLSQSSSGLLHTLSPPPESVGRARVSSLFITSFFNCEGVSLLLMR